MVDITPARRRNDTFMPPEHFFTIYCFLIQCLGWAMKLWRITVSVVKTPFLYGMDDDVRTTRRPNRGSDKLNEEIERNKYMQGSYKK